nr:MAG TPA: hypothetical protein [Caudoviricetes sp.]
MKIKSINGISVKGIQLQKILLKNGKVIIKK